MRQQLHLRRVTAGALALVVAYLAACSSDAQPTNATCAEGDANCLAASSNTGTDGGSDGSSAVEARNDDGVKNGSETDVDCGGQSGKKCGLGRACKLDSDCDVACGYTEKCIEIPSCKPHFGGDTCGGKPLHPGEYGTDEGVNESCCRTLPVPDFEDPMRPGKQVFVDKYEITAGRFRAFLESIAAENNGEPDIKAWVAAHRPPIWDESWDMFLPSGKEAATIETPRSVTNGGGGAGAERNVGTNHAFGSTTYIYVHGDNCSTYPGSYGFPTFWYPDDLLEGRGEVPRLRGADGDGKEIDPQEALDVKSMTCVPSAVLAAFCHWDGGQLVTDEVLDFITDTKPSPYFPQTEACGSRCADIKVINATLDSGGDGNIYAFPFYDDTLKSEGVWRIASPGRTYQDVVRINEGDEPWMDIHGNVHEVALDVTGDEFTGKFTLKYKGIGYLSARAGGNSGPPPKFTFPEYKAGYSGGRCMRFK